MPGLPPRRYPSPSCKRSPPPKQKPTPAPKQHRQLRLIRGPLLVYARRTHVCGWVARVFGPDLQIYPLQGEGPPWASQPFKPWAVQRRYCVHRRDSPGCPPTAPQPSRLLPHPSLTSLPASDPSLKSLLASKGPATRSVGRCPTPPKQEGQRGLPGAWGRAPLRLDWSPQPLGSGPAVTPPSARPSPSPPPAEGGIRPAGHLFYLTAAPPPQGRGGSGGLALRGVGGQGTPTPAGGGG